MIDAIQEELEYRRSMWKALLERGGPVGVAPTVLREIGLFGGGQGIFIDKERTANLTQSGVGVTVSVLHTAGYEADEMFEDGVLYPYPETARPTGRDRAEIEATKALERLGLPLFVIAQAGGARDVRIAWVEAWDDEARVFLLTFGESRPPAPAVRNIDETPFRAFERDPGAKSAPARFEFRVRQRYGKRCAFCDLEVPKLLDAAHLIPTVNRGSDDPRNGLVLCALHHRALARALVAIDPETLELRYAAGGPDARALRITRPSIAHLPALPHRTSLDWCWEQWVARAASE